jgi:hypothetical protein
MPGIQCKCGNIIKSNLIPNPNEWLVISDVSYDKFSGKIDAEELYKEMKTLLVCNNCKRIWIYWNGNREPPLSYSPEGHVSD